MNTNLISQILQRAGNPGTIHDMAEGLSPAPSIKAKATAEDIEKLKNEIKIPIPELLIDILTNVGNGGFGPGYGLYSVQEIIALYNEKMADDDARWLPECLPICTWGCDIYSCIDCEDPDFPVYFYDMGDDHCCDNVSYEVTDKDGNLLSSGSTGEHHHEEEENDEDEVNFHWHKEHFEDFMVDWVNAVDLWVDMMGDDDEDDDDVEDDLPGDPGTKANRPPR